MFETDILITLNGQRYTVYMDYEKYTDAINKAYQQLEQADPSFIELLGDEVQKILELSDASSDPIVFALMYMEVSQELEEKREQYGYLAPRYEFPDGVFPKPVAAVDDETLSHWKNMLGMDINHHSRGRYADLVVQRQTGRERFDYAISAINDYREFAKSSWSSELNKKDSIIRALELAKTFNQQDLISDITNDLIESANTNLSSDDASPGVSLSLLEEAAKISSEHKSEILRLNEIAISKFSDNGFAIDTAHQIQEMLASPEDKQDLYRTQAEFLLSEAKKAEEGFQKFYQLHEVEAFAELHGLNDIRNEAVVLAEAIPQESMEMKEHAYTIEIPKEQTDAFAQAVTADDDLLNAFIRLGHAKAISDYDDSKEAAEKMATNHPMLMLFKSVNIGEANSIINTKATQDEKLEASIIDSEKNEMEIFSIFVRSALDAIKEKFNPDIKALTAVFTSDLIDENEAQAISRGINYYYSDDSDAAAKCLAPIVERIIRHSARKVGIPTTKPPSTSRSTPGGVRGLGEILGSMQGFITDENLRRYWRNSLVDVNGYNLRNRIGHGLNITFDKSSAAILIHVLCTLFILDVQKKTE